MTTKKKRKSGGKYLMESGKRPVLLGLTQEEHAIIAEAAARDQRAVSRWSIINLVALAKKRNLENSSLLA